MRWLADSTLEHLRRVADWPDFSNTKYRVISAIADGGMGVVYHARDRELDRDVAIKVLKDAVPDGQAAQRMRREARIIARLAHPGIVPLHDFGFLPDGRPYYVMKLVRGKQLDALVGELHSINDRLRIFGRICDAVSFAHAHGVVHRDIKPQNVMIGEFGEVLMLDWGVAKVLGDNEAQTVSDGGVRADEPEAAPVVTPNEVVDVQRTVTLATACGSIVGTPAFMSPEQARGDVEQVDQRCDVFALGAMLYWLLTDQMPLDRTTFSSLAKGNTIELKPPRRLNPKISRALSAICMKAMAHEAADRYSDAGAFGEELIHYQNDAPVAAYRAGIMERLAKLMTRHSGTVLLVLFYIVVRVLMIILDRG